MESAIRRLLDELSWEGNARKYRGGGAGLENVLTTEVFQALDFLPRSAFLGSVLAGASGASLRPVLNVIEEASVEILPGDLEHPRLDICAQPDVSITAPGSFVFVEAKRMRRSSFQPEQLAKELLLTKEHADKRDAKLLLVLNVPPPVQVSGIGRVSVDDAIAYGLERISARHGRTVTTEDPTESVAWTTWADLGERVCGALKTYDNPDPSTRRAVRRIVATLLGALQMHA